MQFERHLRVGGRFLVRLECVAQMYRSAFTPMKVVLRAGARNVDIVGGRREAAGTVAAGRCSVGVWHLVGGCAVALIG